MKLSRAALSVANWLTMLAIRLGVPRPPYTRRNALIIETAGRRTGKRRRIPAGFLRDGDPEEYLRRMNSLHSALVRRHSTVPQAVEITVG